MLLFRNVTVIWTDNLNQPQTARHYGSDERRRKVRQSKQTSLDWCSSHLLLTALNYLNDEPQLSSIIHPVLPFSSLFLLHLLTSLHHVLVFLLWAFCGFTLSTCRSLEDRDILGRGQSNITSSSSSLFLPPCFVTELLFRSLAPSAALSVQKHNNLFWWPLDHKRPSRPFSHALSLSTNVKYLYFTWVFQFYATLYFQFTTSQRKILRFLPTTSVWQL